MSVSHFIDGTIPIALGGFMLFRTHQSLAIAERRHAQRLADRKARGTDAHFEELRSLLAYRPIASVRNRRIAGVALIVLGLWLLFSPFIRF